MTNERITKWIDSMEEMAKRELAKFSERFGKDPFYAFSWGDEAIKASAMLNVTDQLRCMNDNPKAGPAYCLSYAMREALRGARSPESSTSHTSNLADQARTIAWATFVTQFSDQA